MSNIGLHKFVKENGISLERTSVGDRNVLVRTLEKGYVIGGEQSGHMIFLEYATTGTANSQRFRYSPCSREAGKRHLSSLEAAPAIRRCSSTSRFPAETQQRMPSWLPIGCGMRWPSRKPSLGKADAYWSVHRGQRPYLCDGGGTGRGNRPLLRSSFRADRIKCQENSV